MNDNWSGNQQNNIPTAGRFLSEHFQLILPIRDCNGANAKKDLADWHHYHNTSVRSVNTRAGAVCDDVGFPGPPMTTADRSLAGTSPPVGKKVRNCDGIIMLILVVAYTSARKRMAFLKNTNLLSDGMQIVLDERCGFKKNKRIRNAKISDVVRDIRKAAAAKKTIQDESQSAIGIASTASFVACDSGFRGRVCSG